ncbi:MAG: PP2C family serine/threonine-protein phosphatase [Vicinamibacterales bacterium]
MRVISAVRTDPGLKRSGNEDAYCVREDLGLYLVADGMGGHAGGEVASHLAATTIERFVADTRAADSQSTWPFAFETHLSVDANRLKTGFRLANRRLADESSRQAALRGMATTASAVLLGDASHVTAAHVGDSRIYRLHEGTLTRLSQDHSWVEEQVRAGVFDARTASQHPWRNVVTRALAGADDPEVDLFELELMPGDRLLICSDGLFAVVDEYDIARLLREEAVADIACNRLVDAANQAGGPDNITVVLVERHVA